MVMRIVAITTACSLINLISEKMYLYLNIKRAVWENFIFHYPHALHALNRARACPTLSGMATECAEIALARTHLRKRLSCIADPFRPLLREGGSTTIRLANGCFWKGGL
jgi:hypothetical protein